MKKIAFVFAALFAITQVAQSQNMTNLHQVCTTEPVKTIHVSSTGKVFYATDGAIDKRIVVYDPTTNIKMTVDTGKGTYYCIEGTTSDVYVGCKTHAIRFTNDGSFVNQITCASLGLSPTAGITAIGTNAVGAYLGSNGGIVIKTSFDLVKQFKLKAYGGSVTAIKFIADTMFVSKNPFDGTNYWGNIFYRVNDDTLSGGIISCLYDLTSKINDLAIWNNNIFTARDRWASFARDGVCGNITTLSNSYFLTMDQYGSKLWGGTAAGEIIDFSGSDGDYTSSSMYSMNVPLYNNVDSIYDIAVDGFGELWVATNKGVYTTATTTTAGINTNTIEANFSIYPNPNNGQFVISNEGEGTLKIIDQLGQTVKTISLNAKNDHYVSVPDLPKGIYFVQIKTKQGIGSKKIIINH